MERKVLEVLFILMIEINYFEENNFQLLIKEVDEKFPALRNYPNYSRQVYGGIRKQCENKKRTRKWMNFLKKHKQI